MDPKRREANLLCGAYVRFDHSYLIKSVNRKNEATLSRDLLWHTLISIKYLLYISFEDIDLGFW